MTVGTIKRDYSLAEKSKATLITRAQALATAEAEERAANEEEELARTALGVAEAGHVLGETVDVDAARKRWESARNAREPKARIVTGFRTKLIEVEKAAGSVFDELGAADRRWLGEALVGSRERTLAIVAQLRAQMAETMTIANAFGPEAWPTVQWLQAAHFGNPDDVSVNLLSFAGGNWAGDPKLEALLTEHAKATQLLRELACLLGRTDENKVRLIA